MEERLTMTEREIDRLKVIHNVLRGGLTWVEAAGQLSLSVRQVGNLVLRVRGYGNKGIIHRLRGRPSNHRVSGERLREATKIIDVRYWDFGPTLANEKLRKCHGIKLSTSTIRQAMIREKIWTPGKRKVRHRAWRERRSCLGEFIQLDGSNHDWFEGRGPRCVLIVYIDDATSRIMCAEFVESEDTLTLMRTTKAYLLRHGRPVSFYVDKDSIYETNRRATIDEELRDEEALTQFTRAMKELGIDVINAHSPQAKGRVERSFRTHQDRLVKELRLAGISTIKEANLFLRKVYIPDHNRRCAVCPASTTDAHRSLFRSHNLSEILSLRTQRTVFNDFTVRFKNKYFQIAPTKGISVRPKDKVLVEIRLDGSTHLRFKNRYLDSKPIAKPSHTSYRLPKEAKEITSNFGKAHKPSANHPWKRAPYNRTLILKEQGTPVACRRNGKLESLAGIKTPGESEVVKPGANVEADFLG